MTRETLYVALTRGRHANHAYTATDTPPAGDAHPAPGLDAPTGREVLAGILAATGTEPSATTARLSIPTYASRLLIGTSVTTVTTGIPLSASRSMAGCDRRMVVGLEQDLLRASRGDLVQRLDQPGCGSLLAQPEAGPDHGRSVGSSASSAWRTADENRAGACITRSTRNVCPTSRTVLDGRSLPLVLGRSPFLHRSPTCSAGHPALELRRRRV